MPTAKVSLFYQLYEQGWSVSLMHDYISSLSELTVDTSFLASALSFAYTTETILKYVRFSDDAIRGDSYIIDLNVSGAGPGNFPRVGQAVTPTAEPNACVELRVESGTTNRKALFLSGIQNAAVIATEPYQAPTSIQIAVNSLNSLWTRSNWKFKGRDTTVPKTAIQGATPVLAPNPGQWTLFFTASPGLTIGQKIFVGGVSPRGGGLTGNYFVSGNQQQGAVWQITLSGGSAPKLPSYTYLGGGYIQQLVPKYYLINNCLIRRPGSRKRGRPFGLRPGRTGKRVITH